MIQYGKIVKFRYKKLGAGKKLELKVKVDERLTNWLPVKTKASSFLVEHLPVRIGDQVLVFNPFGNNEDGFVDRNITYKDIPLPVDVDENKRYIVVEDGTTFIHDIKEKRIDLDTPCDIYITTPKNVNLKATDVNVTCDTSNLKAKDVNVDCTNSKVDADFIKATCKKSDLTAGQVNVDSSDINHGLGGTGVQTDLSICNLTGLPCSNGSKTVKATL